MKKLLITILMAFAFTSVATACPQWECQLPLDDYSCGGVHGCTNACTDTYTPVYDETTVYDQYIYCPYCGHEMWDCVCGTYQESYQETGCDYSYDYGYSESYSCGGSTMSHWANVRDACGNIIGQIGTGSSVEVCGQDPSNPDRVLVYDYCTGTYGSVLSECVYGGYTWDGSGDNGIYNSYQGSGYNANDHGYACDTAYTGTDYSDCGGYERGCDYNGAYDACGSGYGGSGCYEYLRYTEAISIVRSWEMATGCVRTCW